MTLYLVSYKSFAAPDRGRQPQRVDLQADLLYYSHLQSTVAKCYWMHSKWQKSWRMRDAGSEWDSYGMESGFEFDMTCYEIRDNLGKMVACNNQLLSW